MTLSFTKHTINFEKTYLYLIILFALTLPLSRALVSFFIILFPLIWIIEGNYKAKYQIIKETKVFYPLLALFFLSIISLFWTSEYDDAKRVVRLLSYFLSLFVIVTSLKVKYIDKVITAFLSGMFISESITYGVYFKLWTFKHATPQDPSPFMHHIEYSIFLAFTSILLLNRLISKKYILKEKLFFFFFFLTVTGNLFIGIGRSGQVSYIAAIIVMAILHFKISLKSIILSILLLTSIFGTSFVLSKNFHNRVITTQNEIQGILHGNLNSSWGIRVGFWITTFHILEKDPLLGVGIGDYKISQRDEITSGKYDYFSASTKNFISSNHPHNEYLLILLETGLVGLSFFIYFLYKYFTLDIKDRELKQLSILFGVVYSVGFFAEPLLIKQFALSLFILFTSLFILASRQQREYNELQKKIFKVN